MTVQQNAFPQKIFRDHAKFFMCVLYVLLVYFLLLWFIVNKIYRKVKLYFLQLLTCIILLSNEFIFDSTLRQFQFHSLCYYDYKFSEKKGRGSPLSV